MICVRMTGALGEQSKWSFLGSEDGSAKAQGASVWSSTCGGGHRGGGA